MLRVGLTGGIGCGKSTVAEIMRELDCRVLDADAVARDLAEPGRPAYKEILATFGPEILSPGGQMDRAKMAHLVFHDASKLAKLNQILHPRVIAEQNRQLEEIAWMDPHAIAVIEAALLIEAGYRLGMDRLIVVWCRPDQQIDRVTNPRGRNMSRQDAEARMAAQMPLDEKRRLATDEIDNSGSLAATRQQVERLVAQLKIAATGGNVKSIERGNP
jgi:dephospho-CoA kinase